METAIVTGANGFIGRNFVKELIKNGYYVVAIVRDKENCSSISFYGVKIIQCPMEEIEKIEKTIQLLNLNVRNSVFYHLAWAGNSGVERGNYSLQLDNAKFTVRAAEVAARLGCKRFVVTGSVTQLMYRDYLREDGSTPELITCYAVGKLAAEAMLKCVCPKLNIELCWAYVANFYGADDTTENFINFLVNTYLAGKVPELTPAEQSADFIYVTDVARALRYLGEKGQANCSYYVGYGNPNPLKDYIEKIHTRISPQLESGIGKKEFRGMNIDFEKIDYKKLNRDTGFVPRICFEEGIEKVIEARLKERN